MNETDKKEILKLKLHLYGCYKREYEKLERKYFEIHQEIRFNDDPQKAAKNQGYHGRGPHHPAVEEMQIDEASLMERMEKLDEEISYLGLDEFLKSLEPEEWKLIHYIYVDKLTFMDASIKLGMGKTTAHRLQDKILNVGTPFH